MTISIFDKKFVITAVILAAAYTIIVIIVNKVLGKEAAGVAGVALTALTTAIFKQFESLRFQEPSTNNETSLAVIPLQFSWWKIILIAFLFSGITRLLIDLIDGMVPLLLHPTNIYLSDSSIINGKLINHYTIWEQATKCLAYLIAGIVATKAFKSISISVVIIAALIGVILDFYNETLWYVFFGSNTSKSIIIDLEDYKYSFLWIVFSFIGSYISQEKYPILKNENFLKRNRIIFAILGISAMVILILLFAPLLFSKKNKIQFSDASMEYQFLGLKEFENKNYKQALHLFDSAILVNASMPDPYYYKGNCYYELNNYDSAINQIDKSIELNYDKKKAYYIRAFSNYFLQNWVAAIKDYNVLENLDSSSFDDYYFRANCYRILKNYDFAIVDYSKACGLRNPDPDSYYFRGVCYYIQDDYESAVKDFNNAIRLNLDNKDVYSYRGECFYYLKEYRLCIEDFNKAIESNPNNSSDYNLRGAAKVLNNLEGYCEDFYKAAELNDSNGKENHEKYCAKTK